MAESIEKIEAYLKLLQKWNRIYNLTAIRDGDEMRIRHINDSLSVVPFIPKEAREILDLGTGAGLPGLILAISFPDKHFTLLDSSSKKTAFLQECVRQLTLPNVSIVCQHLASPSRSAIPDQIKPRSDLPKADIIISRAFSALSDFIALGTPYLKKNGALYAMKGPKVLEELKSLSIPYHLESLNVPGLNEQRYLVIVRSEA